MTPLASLEREHALIETVLDALDGWAATRPTDGHTSRAVLGEFVVFIREFIGGVHHRREEEVVFSRLAPGARAVLLHERALGAELAGSLERLLTLPAVWDAEERGEVALAAHAYAALMRQHMCKEGSLLGTLLAAAGTPEGGVDELQAALATHDAAPGRAVDVARLTALGGSLAARFGRRDAQAARGTCATCGDATQNAQACGGAPDRGR